MCTIKIDWCPRVFCRRTGLSLSHPTKWDHTKKRLFKLVSLCWCDWFHTYFELDYHLSYRFIFSDTIDTHSTAKVFITPTISDLGTLSDTNFTWCRGTAINPSSVPWIVTASPVAKLLSKGNVCFDSNTWVPGVSHKIITGTEMETLSTKDKEPKSTLGPYSFLTSNFGLPAARSKTKFTNSSSDRCLSISDNARIKKYNKIWLQTHSWIFPL